MEFCFKVFDGLLDLGEFLEVVMGGVLRVIFVVLVFVWLQRCHLLAEVFILLSYLLEAVLFFLNVFLHSVYLLF